MEPPDELDDITRMLRRLSSGDADAESEMFARVYAELKKIAAALMRMERPDHTLQPTALVNEAYLRIVNQSQANWQDRNHFFALAARCMRRILVDSARRRRTDKRGEGAVVVNLEEAFVEDNLPSPLIEGLDEALTRLAAVDPRQAQVVEMRYFGGMSEEEIGDHLGISARTVKRDWRHARAWLQGELDR